MASDRRPLHDAAELERQRFETVPCPTWEDLVRGLEHLGEGWLFRGHRDAAWPLETSLERYRTPTISGPDMENRLVVEFKARAHLHLQPHHVPTNDLEWLALMQHFGAPTRLLDMTASPYVAAYFAVEDAIELDGECAVWAVKEADCQDAATAKFTPLVKGLPSRIRDTEYKALLATVIMRLVEVLGGVYGSTAPRCVIPLRPPKLSERLAVQQGTFLWPCDISTSFMENLLASGLPASSVIRFVLPNRERGRALMRLRMYNVTRATLFPGLDGLAQSLRYLLVGDGTRKKNEHVVAFEAAFRSLKTEIDNPDSILKAELLKLAPRRTRRKSGSQRRSRP